MIKLVLLIDTVWVEASLSQVIVSFLESLLFSIVGMIIVMQRKAKFE